MSKKLVCLYVVGLILVPLAMWAADPAPPAAPASPGCGTKLVDLTDPGLAQRLATMTLVPVGPIAVSYQSTGVTTKIKVSRRDFIAYDEQGNAIAVSAKCTLTCTGSSCLQRGCTPFGSGCAPWDCGSGCTGSCVGVAETDPVPPAEGTPK